MTRLVDVHLVAFELRKFLDLTWAIDSASEVPEGASAGRDAFHAKLSGASGMDLLSLQAMRPPRCGGSSPSPPLAWRAENQKRCCGRAVAGKKGDRVSA